MKSIFFLLTFSIFLTEISVGHHYGAFHEIEHKFIEKIEAYLDPMVLIGADTFIEMAFPSILRAADSMLQFTIADLKMIARGSFENLFQVFMKHKSTPNKYEVKQNEAMMNTFLGLIKYLGVVSADSFLSVEKLVDEAIIGIIEKLEEEKESLSLLGHHKTHSAIINLNQDLVHCLHVQTYRIFNLINDLIAQMTPLKSAFPSYVRQAHDCLLVYDNISRDSELSVGVLTSECIGTLTASMAQDLTYYYSNIASSLINFLDQLNIIRRNIHNCHIIE